MRKIQKKVSRKLRGKRMPDRPVVLTARDIKIFTLVGLTRYMDSNQLANELFENASLDACRKRLRKLYDAGFINITLAGSQSPNLISLTGKGLATIKQNSPEMAEIIKLPGTIRLTGIRHHLASVDARLYVAALCKKHNFTLIEWANAKGNLVNELGLKDEHLLPDGLAAIQTKTKTASDILHIAFEIDCGTESLRVLGNKMKKYQKVFSQNLITELWLVSLSGKQRQRTITEQIKKANLTNKCRLLTIEQIKARPIKEPSKLISKLIIKDAGHKTQRVDNP